MANISFRLCLGLLFWIQSWLLAGGQGEIIVKHALIGQQVNFTCYLNSTEDVTWRYSTDGIMFPISTCKENQNGQCPPANAVLPLFNFQATRSNYTSILSLTPYDEKKHNFTCKLGNNFQQKYSVKSTDPRNIVPNCTITSPRSDEKGVGSMTLSCEVNSDELDVNLRLEGIGLDISNDDQSFKAKTLYFNDFNYVHNASCNAYFPDIEITLSCTYPNIIKAQYVVEGNDIIVECDDELDVVNWRFYGSDGTEEEIENRSWIREGGRSLLIRNISERDVGKVVMCRTKGDDNPTNKSTIGFHVISKFSGNINNSNPEDQAPIYSDHRPYLGLTIFFLSLWLITTAVGGVLLGIRTKKNKSGTSVIVSPSENTSVPNRGSGERETPLLNIMTRARRGPDTLNTNNSAHNPEFEPEVNHTGENSRNRQSNNESHLYFTLEKSSPSPVNSLLRASAARREHPNANPASLNHPQSSHSQCYETVGEPNKGATCSYDLGEYAEVGYQIQGKGTPDLGEYAEVGYQIKGKGPPHLSGRPSIRKKPGREKVKENDISSLYSKVNK